MGRVITLTQLKVPPPHEHWGNFWSNVRKAYLIFFVTLLLLLREFESSGLLLWCLQAVFISFTIIFVNHSKSLSLTFPLRTWPTIHYDCVESLCKHCLQQEGYPKEHDSSLCCLFNMSELIVVL